MTYVDIPQSLEPSERHYVGVTADLRSRLRKHNAGEVLHTSKYAPWEIETYVAFADKKQAFAFEKISNHHRAGPLPRNASEQAFGYSSAIVFKSKRWKISARTARLPSPIGVIARPAASPRRRHPCAALAVLAGPKRAGGPIGCYWQDASSATKSPL
jgi:hypothetical protein